MDYQQPDSTYTSTYLQLGYEAVKDVAGIDSSDLVVLESHVVQSLNKEKSAAQFYMMLCSHSFDERHSVPLEFLVDSLQGSVAVEFNGSWSTTPLVDYHHMLPYVGFISSWIPRKESCKPIFNGCNAHSTNSSYKEELPQSKIPALPPSMCIGEELDHINIDNPEMKSNTSNNDVNENRVTGIQSTKRNGNAREEFKDLGDFLNSFKKVRQITLEEVDKDSGKYERGSFSEPLKGISQNRVKDNHGMQEMDINDYIKSSFKTEERRSSRIKASYQRRKNVPSAQHSANGPEDGVNLKVESANILKSKDSPCRDKKITAENGGTSVSCNPTANILKSKDSPCGDKKITAENGGMTVSCNLTGTAATENAVVKFDAPHNTQEDNTSASESSQNALALLNRKRRELCSQICAMEEKLAVYEHSIERIRDGGEVGFARQCINSILSGKDDLLVSNVQQVLPVENQKDPLHPTNAGLSCSFLPGKSSCQDLEYTCVMNNWRLPRYFIQPSDGKFVANVVVQSKEFNLSSKGDLESSPCKARESSAAQMIAKIREGCALT